MKQIPHRREPLRILPAGADKPAAAVRPLLIAAGPLIAVCSNRPRPSVQKGAKGNQWWKRDVYHIAGAEKQTLCGLDASEWLTIGEVTPDENCCVRCRKRIE